MELYLSNNVANELLWNGLKCLLLLLDRQSINVKDIKDRIELKS